MCGKYIVFEGVTCSGKTTHAKNLVNKLDDLGYKVEYRKNALSNKKIGSVIRNIVRCPIPSLVDDMLYLTDFYLNDLEIKKKIGNGYFIIADRYLPSLEVFNETHRKNFVGEIDKKLTKKLEGALLEPDIVFYLTCNPEERKQRANQKKDLTNIDVSMLENDRLMNETEEKLEEKLKRYRKVIKIDTTNKKIEEVDQEIIEKLLKELGNRR
jgi:dTMP kinase